MANSGAKEATTWSNLERWEVILRQANCASTWTNQISGSAGQKGGSFKLTAETSAEAGAEPDPEVGGGSGLAPEARGSAIPERVPSPSIAQKVLRSVGVTNVARFLLLSY